MQYVLWHCDGSPHAVPLASCPATAWQALGGLFDTMSAHCSPATAFAQPSMMVGVIPVPLAARAVVHVAWKRVSHVATSPYWS